MTNPVTMDTLLSKKSWIADLFARHYQGYEEISRHPY